MMSKDIKNVIGYPRYERPICNQKERVFIVDSIYIINILRYNVKVILTHYLWRKNLLTQIRFNVGVGGRRTQGPLRSQLVDVEVPRRL